MPVDELLRDAFDRQDEAWTLEAESALSRVHERFGRRSERRRRIATGVVTAVLVPAAVMVGVLDPSPEAMPAPPSSSQDPPPSAASAQPLDGRWRTVLVTDADVRRTLEAADLEHWTDPVLARLPERPFEAVMRIGDRRVNLHVLGPDGRPRHLDGQTSNVVGDHLRLSSYWSREATSYRWRVVTRGTGSTATAELSLDLEATTEQARGGIPGEAWMRVLYTSGDFVGEERP